MSDLLNRKPTLFCKLASVVVHADELAGPNGHDFDRVALESIINDPEVRQWIDAMTAAGLAPVKRS